MMHLDTLLKPFLRFAFALFMLCGLVAVFTPAHALEPVTFATDWKAQAEQGGFYQAKALGLYRRAGLDVTLRGGGPGVNIAQLLLMKYLYQIL